MWLIEACKAIRFLANILKSLSILIEIKIKLYLIIPINLALWNAEICSIKTSDLKL